MDADWYEDPLGRYDGRFFDGSDWTERVSSGGVLRVDPDFALKSEAAVEATAEPVSAGFEHESSAAAVEPLRRELPRHATTAAESPVRTVAVLDDSVLASSEGSTSPASSNRTGWRWLGLALAAALAALLVLFIASRGGGDESVAVDTEIDERVEDLQSGGLPDTQSAAQAEELAVDAGPESGSETVYGPDDAIQLGDFLILNGAPVLQELGEWHRTFVADRNIELGPQAGCWFGQLGEAAVGVVQCGPVAGDVDSDYQYDLVPVDFVVTGDDIVVRPVFDRVTPDAVVANALQLVGYPGGPTPPYS